MAGFEGSPEPQRLETTSYETAICIVPPSWYCQEVDKLRELYDKGYGRWPPHINLVYPFVAVEHLPQAKKVLETRFGEVRPRVHLNDAGFFQHRQGYTIFASEAKSSADGSLARCRSSILEAIGQPPSSHEFHLTVGQSADASTASRDFLLSKAKRLPSVEFDVHELIILVRVRSSDKDRATNHMQLWGRVPCGGGSSPTPSLTPDFWIQDLPPTMSEDEEQRMAYTEEVESDLASFMQVPGRPQSTFTYDGMRKLWQKTPSPVSQGAHSIPKTVKVATYNVLMDSEYPPSSDRYSKLVDTIVSEPATADVLVLAEVSDEFLDHCLSQQEIRSKYPFCAHGPSAQEDVGPMPSLRNLVIFSRFQFTWTWLPFQRRHKGAAVAVFSNIGVQENDTTSPLVLAAIHLTSGLTDGAVAAKKVQISSLLNYLKREHPGSPWMIAGDFNITTSSYTIETALRDKSITLQTTEVLSTLDKSFTETGFVDAWSVARIEGTDQSTHINFSEFDDTYDGEEGATFNPRENVLAAKSSGTSNNRPQRYDRILIRGMEIFRTSHFNMFGMPQFNEQVDADGTSLEDAPSDHFGVRATFEVSSLDRSKPSSDGFDFYPSCSIASPKSEHMSLARLSEALDDHGMFPTEEDCSQRREALSLLKNVIKGVHAIDQSSPSQVLLEVTAVGSYGLGVWSAASDVDCLCIGNISHKTFFKLVRQRLRRAADLGVQILRKVEATSGTMLELSVNGIPFDLQYCAATKVVERWSSIVNIPHNDPCFDLPILSLRKLKPYRDLDYIQRTIPNTPAFRLAFRSIKLWAIRTGTYSSKFGYLGGIHITLMLSIICKQIVRQVGQFTAEDLIGSFFRTYAEFDWEGQILYDPFFFKNKPKYHRTNREPMAILGFYAPNSNIAHTSTISSVDVLKQEFSKASQRLANSSMTWTDFFGIGDAFQEFLQVFDDYIRIDVQYWGRTLSRGRSLVGWLESRTLNLIVDVKKIIPNVTVRIWPARFCSLDAGTTHDYSGCYLIGLTRSQNSSNIATRSERKVDKEALIATLKRFENQVLGDEKYYDATTSWIGVNLIKRNEIGSLEIDQRSWGDLIDEDDANSESDDEATEGEDEQNDLLRPLPIHDLKRGEAKKLRPASDVLNRLRWDSNLQLGDYIIGYEDRFLGAKETTLEKWKTEKTDEEFIPQHRILYFRRRSDGLVVWERRTRIDRIFGSGIGGGELPSEPLLK